ncbi:unnamed protein product [Moneuplotes crassus]|uniref:Rab-GAP TBC domain-containing protein n=1 Tax=Euplotes crassus TaxID=5936 RepID=A0AAD2D9C6_EUPCR|nr:unnamed protein product [Moneuplotes crassus]
MNTLKVTKDTSEKRIPPNRSIKRLSVNKVYSIKVKGSHIPSTKRVHTESHHVLNEASLLGSQAQTSSRRSDLHEVNSIDTNKFCKISTKRKEASFKHFLSNTTKNRARFKHKLRAAYTTNFGSMKDKKAVIQRNRNPIKSLNLKSRNKKESISENQGNQLSVGRYRSRGYGVRTSMLENENCNISPVANHSLIKKRYKNSFSKENSSLCSLYKKAQDKVEDNTSNPGTLDDTKKKLTLRELHPMMMSNKDISDANSRNSRKIKYSKLPIQSSRRESTSRRSSKSESKFLLLQPSSIKQSRIMKHKTLNELKNKSVEKTVSDIKTGSVLQKWLTKGRSTTPSSPVIGENLLKKARKATLIPNFKASDISCKQTQGCLKTFKKKIKRLNNVHKKFGKNSQLNNCKRLTYDNANSLKTSVLTENIRSSVLNTKATVNLNIQPDVNILHNKEDNMKMHPISEIFDEENKENKENKESNAIYENNYERHRILASYKSSGQFAKFCQNPTNQVEAYKKTIFDDSNIISSYKSNDEANFSIKMSDTDSRRLDNLKDYSTTDKLFSTNVSIDPNSCDEEIKKINFLPKIKGNQCSCMLSSVSTLKCCISMQKWLSICFLGEEDQSFNPRDNPEFNKLIEFFYRTKIDEKQCDEDSQLCKDLNRTFQMMPYFREGSRGYSDARKLLLKFLAHPLSAESGYVQGMNMIASTLLYHGQADVAFCLFVKMFEKHNIIHNYEPGMPGITDHCLILEKMVSQHCRTLYNYFHTQAIPVQMYTIELICGLFGGKIPIEKYKLFYDNFIPKGWPFFYALVVQFLEEIQFNIMEEEELTPQAANAHNAPNLKWDQLISKAIDFEYSHKYFN